MIDRDRLKNTVKIKVSIFDKDSDNSKTNFKITMNSEDEVTILLANAIAEVMRMSGYSEEHILKHVTKFVEM